MPIYYANNFIKNLRHDKKMTQEEFCENICSTQALSKIENGKQGISPYTFERLCERVGVYIKPYPCFSNWDEYNCFFLLNRVKLYLDTWSCEKAYDTLKSVEKIKFANNRYIYQKWLYYHILLQDMNSTRAYKMQESLINKALSIDGISIEHVENIGDDISYIDIKLFVILVNVYVNNGNYNKAEIISKKMLDFIKNRNYPHNEELIEINCLKLSQIEIHIKNKMYEKALFKANAVANEAKNIKTPRVVIRANYLKGLSLYYLNKQEEAMDVFRQIIGTIRCIDAECLNYYVTRILKLKNLNINNSFIKLKTKIKKYKYPKLYDVQQMGYGIFDMKKKSVVTFGKIIKHLREIKKLSTHEVYSGLCSKSHFSKIENDLQPVNAVLAEAILQRVGIFERLFVFFGSSNDFKYQELSDKLSFLNGYEKKEANEIIKLLINL